MNWSKAVPIRVIGLTLFCLAFGPPLAAEGYRFEKIRVPGSVETQPRGINARGHIVGTYVDRNGASHGFLLRKGVFTTIDFPGESDFQAARGINARGDIVGNFADSAVHGYLLSDGVFTQIDYPGASETFVHGINNAGDILGKFPDHQGFIRKDGKFHAVEVPGGWGVNLFAAQDNGRVLAGTLLTDDGFSAFVGSRRGGFTVFHHPEGVSCTSLRSINQRGDLVGTFWGSPEEPCSEAVQHGYVLRDGQFIQIDYPGAAATDAFASNDDGVVVGRYFTQSGKVRGFMAVPID
jgi:uncharacterized membrane protein